MSDANGPGDPCPYCFKVLTHQVFKEKLRRKQMNALNSTAKMKANGNKPGPARIRNDEQIRELRQRGLSIRAIAREIGLSSSTVHKAVKP